MSWRKLGMFALVAFLIYFVVRSPVESATVVKDASHWIAVTSRSIASSLTTFLQTLF